MASHQQQQQTTTTTTTTTGAAYSETTNKHPSDDDIEFLSSKPVKKPRLGQHDAQENQRGHSNITGSQVAYTQQLTSQADQRNGMIAPVADMSPTPLDAAPSTFASFAFSPHPLPLPVSATRTSEAISPKQLPQPEISPLFPPPQPRPSSNLPVVSHPQIPCIDVRNFGNGTLDTATHSVGGLEAGSKANKPLGGQTMRAAQHATGDLRPQPGFASPCLSVGFRAATGIVSAPIFGDGLHIFQGSDHLTPSPFLHGRLILSSSEGHSSHPPSLAMAPSNVHGKRSSPAVPKNKCPCCIRKRQIQTNVPPYPQTPHNRLTTGLPSQQFNESITQPIYTNTEPSFRHPNLSLPPIRPNALANHRQIQVQLSTQSAVEQVEAQQRAQQQDVQPTSAIVPKNKPPPCLSVDLAEWIERNVPYNEFATRHNITEDKVREKLSSTIQLPLLRGSERRRAGKLAHQRQREWNELHKHWGAEDNTSVAGLMRALDRCDEEARNHPASRAM